MSNSRQNKRTDLSQWILPIFLLMALPPIGIALLVLKVLDDRKNPRTRHPYYTQQEGQAPTGARTTAPKAGESAPVKKAAAKKKTAKKNDPLALLTGKAKKLTRIGAIIAGICAFVFVTGLSESFYWLVNNEWQWFVGDLLDMLPFLCGLGGGVGCLWAGLRKDKQAKRFRTYLNMIGRRTSISISALASASGRTASQVREDMEEMLNSGLFPAGYLDYGGDMLVLSGEGLRDEPPVKKPSASPTVSEEDAILAEIRAVNDAITNEKLSAQIDRVGVITAKILDYQKSNPAKAPQLHSFLSYYLPTTLKILRAYGRLEAQEVSGQNITAAMERIEGMMDKVVEGFEKQLDQLFQGDTMDITTDVEVLERMLAKDGLSDSRGMTLGL